MCNAAQEMYCSLQLRQNAVLFGSFVLREACPLMFFFSEPTLSSRADLNGLSKHRMRNAKQNVKHTAKQPKQRANRAKQ